MLWEAGVTSSVGTGAEYYGLTNVLLCERQYRTCTVVVCGTCVSGTLKVGAQQRQNNGI